MKVAGIVAEYNPFHNGHQWQINEVRRRLGDDTAVLAVMSGNWVQRGECAAADKWTRARMALEGGADLILELPTPWAISSAEGFAQGAAALLHATGVVDVLCFGSECGNVNALGSVAQCLESAIYRADLRRFLDDGLPFAVCRQEAVRGLLGPELAGLLSQPNNNLGVEYLRALSALNSPILPMTLPRQGADHDSLEESGFPSATLLRQWLRAGEEDRAAPYLPVPWRGETASMAWCERAVLARLRTMTVEELQAFPGSGEGLAVRLIDAARRAAGLEELYAQAKTKRFAHSRVRRLALWAYLGLREDDRPQSPPYLRVLGFNQRGRLVLREMAQTAALPILGKPAYVKRLSPQAQTLFGLEAQCTGLYDLCLPTLAHGGREWTTSPVILRDPEP